MGPRSEGHQVIACLPKAPDGTLPVTSPAQAAAVIAFQQGELEGQGQGQVPGQLPGGGEGFLGTSQVTPQCGQVTVQAGRRHAGRGQAASRDGSVQLLQGRPGVISAAQADQGLGLQRPPVGHTGDLSPAEGPGGCGGR